MNECFPNEWKKANNTVHKNVTSKKLPTSITPAYLFEKVIFHFLFKYLGDHKLLNCNQSGFRLGDSFVHQLLSITHEIYKSLEANLSLEVRGVFVDISKNFD